MRKILALLLAALLVFCCVGCGEKDETGSTTAPQKTEAPKLTTTPAQTTENLPTQVTLAPTQEVTEEEVTTTEGEKSTTIAEDEDSTTTATVTTTTKTTTTATSTTATKTTITTTTTISTTTTTTKTGVVTCDHVSVSRPGCTTPGICDACGAEVKPAAGHKYYKGKCLICKEADPKMAITSVKLDKTAVTLLEGATVTLKATVEPAEAANNLTWTSSNTAVATVGKDGKVEAVAVGEATITAEGDGKKATCKVTVAAVTLVMEGGQFPTKADGNDDDMVELAYNSDYSRKLKTFFGITDVTYEYNVATRVLKIHFVGNITYNAAGNPTPTTPSFGARVMAGNGSTAGDIVWKADHADSPPAQYTGTLEFTNVEPGPYTVGFYETYEA